MSPRRKSLRGTFARLSLRKHRKRQVLANLRMCSWTNLSLVLVYACRANALHCQWTEPSNWLVQRRVCHAIWDQYLFHQSAACAAKFNFWLDQSAAYSSAVQISFAKPRFDCFSGEWFRLLDLLYSAIAGVRGKNIVSFVALVSDWCNELIVSSQARSCFPVVVVKHRSWRVQFVLTLIKNVTIMVCLYFLFS